MAWRPPLTQRLYATRSNVHRLAAMLAGHELAPLAARAESVAMMLKLLANAERLQILCRISDHESSVGDLVEQSNLSQSSVSQHLAKLREGGLVATRREAQTIYYRLSEERVRALMQVLCNSYSDDAR